MTPTPKDPDSFGGWSDADVLQVLCGDTPFPQVGISGFSGQVTDGGMFLDPVCTSTRCQPFAFGDLRVIMSEPSLNVQMIGCRARVGTQMPVGRPCWSQIIRFHHRVTEHFPFLFCTRQKKQCNFSLELHFLQCWKKYVF